MKFNINIYLISHLFSIRKSTHVYLHLDIVVKFKRLFHIDFYTL